MKNPMTMAEAMTRKIAEFGLPKLCPFGHEIDELGECFCTDWALEHLPPTNLGEADEEEERSEAHEA